MLLRRKARDATYFMVTRGSGRGQRIPELLWELGLWYIRVSGSSNTALLGGKGEESMRQPQEVLFLESLIALKYNRQGWC